MMMLASMTFDHAARLRSYEIAAKLRDGGAAA